MPCPEASELESFLDGSLSAAGREVIELHLDDCDECRRTVALLAPGLTRAVDSPDAIGSAETMPSVDGFRPLLSGGTIGRYLLLERIGAGGMGVVYAAEDPELGRKVAIKVLKSEMLAGDPEASGRIIREARAMARVSHPNVVTVFDAGRVDDQVFIAMELVPGTSLRAWMVDHERTAADIVDTFSAAGLGLAAAHDAGLVHRDFKPDNVLVGDDGRVRVTDFGLAIPNQAPAAAAEDGDRSVTTTRIAGTPAYMAPEQHVGGHVDARSDQFSFAASLYEALHGARPFQGDTYEELSKNVLASRFAPPPAGARVPGSLRRILLRAMSTRPGDRFESMNALLRALGRDRARAPRRLAVASLALLSFILFALGADWVARERAAAVTRTAFTAARAQLARLVARRVEAFVAMSSLFSVTPIMLEVAAATDEADFGLADPSRDRQQLEYVHKNLQSADWVSWMRAIQGTDFAIADYKGRLLYASADPARWGDDVTHVRVLDEAYQLGAARTRTAVLRADDRALAGSGLLGRPARHGLEVLMVRPAVVGDTPRALFVQLMPGARLLEDVSLGEGTQMALVATDHTADGSVPADVVAAAPGEAGGIDEVVSGGAIWMVQRFALASPGSDAPVASIVLARRLDVGLAGLFPGARPLLAALAALLLALATAFAVLARRMDLSRRSPRARRPPP